MRIYSTLRRLFLATVLLTVTVGSFAQWSVPESHESAVQALTPEQAAFIRSGAALEFMPERQLLHELETRDADAIAQLINDLVSLAVEMGFDESRDMGAIPLNLTARRFNAPVPTPPALRKFDRKPGPFSVHRYQYPRSGVPTFGGARVAIWPEDLVAGQVDVAIVGVPSNMSSGRRDAGAGPDAMRALNTISLIDDQSLIAPLNALTVVDYGNFFVDNMSAELTAHHVVEMVRETAETGAIPMIVGGDTSLLFAGVKGIAQSMEGTELGLLHLGSHADVNQADDHTLSDDKALFALLEQGVVRGQDTVTLGLQGDSANAQSLGWLREQGVRYHTMVEVQERGFERVLDSILKEVERGPDRFFVSVDVSVIAPSEMAAAGRISPYGLHTRQATRVIRQVCASKDIAAFEITDLAPMLDHSRVSVLSANALLNACLSGIAVRRAGLKADYVNPLVLSHGQR